MTADAQRLPSFGDGAPVARIFRRYLARASVTLIGVMILSAFLLPLASMFVTALEHQDQRTTPGAPVYPASPATGMYQGESYPIYAVPLSGGTRDLLLVTKGRTQSTFIDPSDPTQTPIV